MEEEVKEITPMELDKFKDYLKENKLLTLEGVSRFKSLNRAIKRGHILPEGIIIPKRPFNNRANSTKRKEKFSSVMNNFKKRFHEKFGNILTRGIQGKEETTV